MKQDKDTSEDVTQNLETLGSGSSLFRNMAGVCSDCTPAVGVTSEVKLCSTVCTADKDRKLLAREGLLYKCMEGLLLVGYWFEQIWEP